MGRGGEGKVWRGWWSGGCRETRHREEHVISHRCVISSLSLSPQPLTRREERLRVQDALWRGLGEGPPVEDAVRQGSTFLKV